MINMDLIRKRERFGSRLGLAKIRILCQQMGNPQDSLQTIHIAGTNGKGSVAAFLRSVLQECGLRVGVYSSPHLVHYNERFTINEAPISDNDLRRLSEIVEEAATAVEETNPELGPVTEFEFATALGFLYFSTMDTDVVILETGLGGRLDATNIVLPKLTIITPIGHDHMDRLGETISEIAAEKGGIIKPRIPVVVSEQKKEAAQVLAEIARHQQAPLF